MPKKIEVPEFVYCSGGCGEKIYLDSVGRRARYRKTGKLYCLDCVKKINSERMKKQNPMDNPAILEKMRRTIIKKGIKPKILGGNGRGYSKAQELLWKTLGRGWWAELSIPTGHYRDRGGLPTNYKVDLANIYYGIAIEVDGGTHYGAIAREEDRKKAQFLESKGWTLLRFRNKEVLNNLDSVMAEITSTILKSRETIITLPMEY